MIDEQASFNILIETPSWLWPLFGSKTGLLLVFSHSLNNMLSVWQEGSNRRMPFFDINCHCWLMKSLKILAFSKNLLTNFRQLTTGN